MSAIPSGFEWRVGQLEQDKKDFAKDLRKQRELSARHEEQINGENGLLSVMHEVKEEMSNVRKALYTAAGGAVFSAITVATSIAIYAH